MNKSLLISSFAVLTASVFGMDPGYHGESSGASHSNQLLRDIKQENPVATAPTQNFESNVQNSTDSGSNVLELMQQVLNENQSAKLEIQQKDKEIQDLRNKLASEYVTSSKLFEKLTESQNLNRRLSKINKNLTIFDSRRENNPRKRSRSAGEDQLKREFKSMHLPQLWNALQKKDDAIAEYKNQQKSLKAENQELRKKLDKTNQEVNALKKQRSLKVFEGEVLNTVENSEIDLSKYGTFPNLKKLTTRTNQLSDILRNKPDLSNITTLDIYYHEKMLFPITQLTDLFRLAPNTEKLDLRNCKLTCLPKEIGNLKDLRKLNLGYNNLSSLPKEVGNLKNLKYLYLWDNKLTELPKEIYALPKLQVLDITSNPLKKLSKKDFVSSNLEIRQ